MASDRNSRAVAGCLDAVWQMCVVLTLPAAQALLTMWALAVVHGYFAQVPAAGFWDVWIVVIAARWLINGDAVFTGTRKGYLRRAAARKAADEREAAAAAPQDPRVQRLYND